MTALELLQRVRIDGILMGGVQQITIDAEKTTVIYDVTKVGGEAVRRVITAETEAISFE